jgi:hypothetical protein
MLSGFFRSWNEKKTDEDNYKIATHYNRVGFKRLANKYFIILDIIFSYYTCIARAQLLVDVNRALEVRTPHMGTISPCCGLADCSYLRAFRVSAIEAVEPAGLLRASSCRACHRHRGLGHQQRTQDTRATYPDV